MIGMSTKQKIILRRYRDGDSERKISRELKINRETVRRYLFEYEKSRQKLSNSEKEDEVLIEELVKVPKYDSSNRDNQKFNDEISQEVDRLLQLNEEKRSRGLHKQVMKKIDMILAIHRSVITSTGSYPSGMRLLYGKCIIPVRSASLTGVKLNLR